MGNMSWNLKMKSPVLTKSGPGLFCANTFSTFLHLKRDLERDLIDNQIVAKLFQAKECL